MMELNTKQSLSRVYFRPVGLEFQKPTTAKDCFIDLFDSCLRYVMDFKADEPKDMNDVSLGEEEVHNSFDVFIHKDKITGIEKSITTSNKWVITIITNGLSVDLKIYYNTEKAATVMYIKLISWKFDLINNLE